MDLSVEDAVRNLIAPRCLNDIINMSREKSKDDSNVIPDDCDADSFVLRKGHGDASCEAEKRPTKPVVLLPVNASRECLPRKKTCAGSDRDGREKARMMLDEGMDWFPIPSI